MHDVSEARWNEAALVPRDVVRSLQNLVGSLVSADVEAPHERDVQARVLAGFLVLGLLTAVGSPVAAAAGLGLGWILSSILASGVFLAAAFVVALTGRLDLVAGAVFVAVAGATTLLGAVSGFYAPLLALGAVPLEAALARRQTLAGWAAGTLVACGAVLGSAALAGWLASPTWSLSGFAFGLPFIARLVVEASRRFVAVRDARQARRAERDALLGAGNARLLRFRPDGTPADDDIGQLEAAFGPVAAAGDLLRAIHLPDRLPFLKAFDDLRGGAGTACADVRIADGEDGHRAVSLRLLPVRGRGGALISVLASVDDRTEQNAVAERLMAALASAEGASVAKSEFLAAVSHELRTPLNAIIGFSETLDKEFFGRLETPKQKEYVGLIRHSGEHLLQLVNGLLDVSKIEAGHYDLFPEPFVVREVAESAAGMIRAAAENKGLAFAVTFEGGTEFTADRQACRQILLNLLSNAVKFTEQGAVTLAVCREADALRFVVGDSGIGIAAGDLLRLGRPFVQVSSGLSRRYAGTGLGLSLVKGLVDLHGGTMQIESDPGSGTRVTVTIPDDCAETIGNQRSLKENIVTFTDARKKARPHPQNGARRQSA